MDLHKPVRDPELAHCHFDCGLDAENQLIFGQAQIEKTPVESFVDICFGLAENIDRQGCICQRIDSKRL
jgi:hypothetical protein